MKNKHTKIPSFIIPYVTRKTRLDYQLLFRKMSPHSPPEGAAGRVRFPLLVSANHVTPLQIFVWQGLQKLTMSGLHLWHQQLVFPKK